MVILRLRDEIVIALPTAPAVCCNLKDIAGRQTLPRAPVAPCGHILKGTVTM
jgi:hypothetical protein